jgi:hypothetical protein
MRIPLALLLLAMTANPALAQDESMAPPELANRQADQPGQADPAPPADNAGSMEQSTQTSGSYHSETRTSSTSVSVEPTEPWQSHRQEYSDRDSYGPQVFAGRWQLASADGSSSCGITLTLKKWSGDKMIASIPAGCPGSLFNANSWRLIGHRLELNSGMGDALASFRPAGPNRWQGSVAATGDAIYLAR